MSGLGRERERRRLVVGTNADAACSSFHGARCLQAKEENGQRKGMTNGPHSRQAVVVLVHPDLVHRLAVDLRLGAGGVVEARRWTGASLCLHANTRCRCTMTMDGELDSAAQVDEFGKMEGEKKDVTYGSVR